MKKNSRSSWVPEKKLENFSLFIGVSTDFLWIKQRMSTSADDIVHSQLAVLGKTRMFDNFVYECSVFLRWYVLVCTQRLVSLGSRKVTGLSLRWSTYDKKLKKFQQHLLKCRKNHPDKDFVSCPFNAKHVMLRSEIRHHVSRCPDRVSGINTVWYGHMLVCFFWRLAATSWSAKR